MSRVNGQTLAAGDPYLVAEVALDADPDFRADVRGCLAPWRPGEPPSFGDL